MAVGDLLGTKTFTQMKILEDQATANNPPTQGTFPEALALAKLYQSVQLPGWGSLKIHDHGGSGVITATFRLWLGDDQIGRWYPGGKGADTTKGTLNDGAAIGETTADELAHAEPIFLVDHWTHVYLEVIAPGGTTPNFDAWLCVSKVRANQGR